MNLVKRAVSLGLSNIHFRKNFGLLNYYFHDSQLRSVISDLHSHELGEIIHEHSQTFVPVLYNSQKLFVIHLFALELRAVISIKKHTD